MSPLTIKIFDVTQLPVVASQPAAPPFPDPDPVKALAADLRRAMAQHDACCKDARCLYRANLLAYLARAMKATRADLQRLPSYLVAYDLRCGEEGRCDFHRECASEKTLPTYSPGELFRLSLWTFLAAAGRLASTRGWLRVAEKLQQWSKAGLTGLSMSLRN